MTILVFAAFVMAGTVVVVGGIMLLFCEPWWHDQWREHKSSKRLKW